MPPIPPRHLKRLQCMLHAEEKDEDEVLRVTVAWHRQRRQTHADEALDPVQ